MKSLIRKSAFLLFLLLFLNTLYCEVRKFPLVEGTEQDYSIFLVTTGPGEEVYLWWGHTGIIVRNNTTRQDAFYDFGVFSFETDHFFRNFLMGRLWYMGYRSSVNANLNRTIREDRLLRIQELRFPPGKKFELIENLETRVSPENRSYLYDYYSDNCATRIRDVLDTAYDGALKAVSEKERRQTLRYQTRRYSGRNHFIEWGLMFLMGPRIDRNISGWDAMFLPDEIPLYLEALTISSGPDAGKKVIISDTITHRPEAYTPPPAKPGASWPYAAAFGLLLGGILIAGRFIPSRLIPAAFLFQIIFRTVLLLAAVAGSILFFISLFTDHSVAHNNWNLLLLNPLHLLSLAAPYKRSAPGTDVKKRKRSLLLLPWLFTAGAAVLLGISGIVKLISQDLIQIAAFLLPLSLGILFPYLKK